MIGNDTTIVGIEEKTISQMKRVVTRWERIKGNV